MPEGPSILILREELKPFIGKKVTDVSGNRKIDLQRLKNRKITDIKSFGKQLLICFGDLTVRIHLLLFGTYRINERKESVPRMRLNFSRGEVNFYGCSVQFLEGDINSIYDWSGDVLSDKWSPAKARKKLKDKGDTLVCDALLDQNIFAGVGNIIKNEVCYRIRLHPATKIKNLSAYKLNQFIKEARNYSFDFLEWKKKFVLKKNWLIHTKKTCRRCNLNVTKKHLGKTNRRTFYCENCQVLY
jgi:endonuclease VIII